MRVDSSGSLSRSGNDSFSVLVRNIRLFIQSQYSTREERAAYLEHQIRGQLPQMLQNAYPNPPWPYTEDDFQRAIGVVVDQGADWPEESQGRSHYFPESPPAESANGAGRLSPAAETQALLRWSDDALDEVASLPRGLKLLDLRHARRLSSLPALPESLETLDLTGCSALATLPCTTRLRRLRYLYLGGCAGLSKDALETFLRDCVDWAVLRELELFRSSALEVLELPRGMVGLRHLDVSGCTALKELRGLEHAAGLEHLNAEGCPELRHLGKLPITRLQFLGLHGCTTLRQYLCHDLNERHRGLESGENVAGIFRLLTKLHCEAPVDFPRCKVVFLGNGGGGKSTLAKALYWDDLRPGADRDWHRSDWDPDIPCKMTHAVSLKEWPARLNVPGEDGSFEARVRLWDFGGQEIYHGTHRSFAASGSVYVIVDSGVLRSREESELPPELHEEYHRSRPLAYWLEYIRSLGGEPRKNVFVVHGRNSRTPDRRPPGRETIPASLIHLKRFYDQRVAGEFWIGCHDENDERGQTQFGDFKRALREALADQVVREGRRMSPLLMEVIESVEAARLASQKPGESHRSRHALASWGDWSDEMLAKAGRHRVPGFDEEDVAVVTRMMHRAGDLFLLETPGGDRHVIRDQVWILRRIYNLLDHPDCLSESAREFRRRTRAQFGEFISPDLFAAIWPENSSQPELQALFLRFLEAVELCAHKQSVAGEPDRWLALDPFLLPEFDEVSDTIERGFRPPPGVEVIEGHSFYTFGPNKVLDEASFRKLQGWLARARPRMIRVWRNALQYEGWTAEPAMAYRLEWHPAILEGYAGYIRVTARAAVSPEISDPAAAIRRALRDAFRPNDPFPLADGREFDREEEAQEVLKRSLPGLADWKCLPDDLPVDVAFSTRGSTREIAEALERELKARGRRAFVYSTDDTKQERSDVFATLRDARLTVLIVGGAYLEASFANNQYSLEELWDAVLSWAKEYQPGAKEVSDLVRRSPSKRIGILYLNAAGFRFHEDFRNAATRALAAFRTGIDEKRNSRSPSDPRDDLRALEEKAEHAAKFLSPFAEFWTQQNPPSGHFKWEGTDLSKLANWVDQLVRMTKRDL